jgi:hypothetical protein
VILTQVKNFHQLRPIFGHVNQKPYGDKKVEDWRMLQIQKGNINDIFSKLNISEKQVEIKDKYLDELAPMSSISTENDFSTASIQRLQGPNLTADILRNECKDYSEMALKVLQKCPVLDYDTLVRIVEESSELKVRDQLAEYLFQDNGIVYLDPETNELILKSEFIIAPDDTKTQLVGEDPFIEKQMSWIQKK